MKNFSTFDNTMLKSVLQMDRSLFYYINNRWSNDVFDAVMPFIRNQYLWAPLYLFLLVFVFTNFGRKAWWWLLFFLASFALTDLISAQVIKVLVERPRPCVDPIASETVRMLIPCSYSYSFVSSHATNHFGMAMFMFMSMKQFSKRWIWLVFAWAFIISFAQIYVGAHFPVDVFCGSLLGMFIGHRIAVIFNKQFGGLQIN